MHLFPLVVEPDHSISGQMTSNSPGICAITGATGYVGGRLRGFLDQHGWETVSWSRRPSQTGRHVPFVLGEAVDPRQLEGVRALVHCAYDFGPRRWNDIHSVNVMGSKLLFQAARAAGVENVVFISSVSAFEGCRSLYGRAKLAIERAARDAGSMIIRPGLVYGTQPGGVFGGLVRQVSRGRIIPLVGGGRQRQYLVHEEDLGRLVREGIAGEIELCQDPITLAHERGWTLRELLEVIAETLGRQPVFIPLPWRLVWLALKGMEVSGLPAPFRSDSLIGMVFQNKHPSFEAARRLDMTCRPFQLTRTMLE